MLALTNCLFLFANNDYNRRMEKKTIMLGMLVGSVVGGGIPMLWGADILSFAPIIFTVIGGLLGIWLAYKLVGS